MHLSTPTVKIVSLREKAQIDKKTTKIYAIAYAQSISAKSKGFSNISTISNTNLSETVLNAYSRAIQLSVKVFPKFQYTRDSQRKEFRI